ncbi:MAG: NUDIX hydrolase [Symbiobacteriaceae bacterium]|nr:NUDIX hydrolase [Symbiobacteriaceae bacterium]
MLIRNCAGGVVFNGDKVLLLKNEKAEWVLPKGVIRPGAVAQDTALQRVQLEAGVDANIIDTAGQTSYEFFSVSRQRPVCNRITWYLMKAEDAVATINLEEGFTEGGFFQLDEALEMITYSQDKSLVALAYRKLTP